MPKKRSEKKMPQASGPSEKKYLHSYIYDANGALCIMRMELMSHIVDALMPMSWHNVVREEIESIS
jgi:hypothetical protein